MAIPKDQRITISQESLNLHNFISKFEALPNSNEKKVNDLSISHILSCYYIDIKKTTSSTQI